MKEYYIDITEFSGDLARWLIDQGSATTTVEGWGEPTWKDLHIFIGRRRVHKFAGSNSARLFFDENTIHLATAILLMYPTIVTRHNIHLLETE